MAALRHLALRSIIPKHPCGYYPDHRRALLLMSKGITPEMYQSFKMIDTIRSLACKGRVRVLKKAYWGDIRKIVRCT